MSDNKWQVLFLPKAAADLKALDGSVRKHVEKAIDKVRLNPLPKAEGGYGKPLGNKYGNNLTGLLKIKLKQSGVRIVYSLQRDDKNMLIVIIGIRTDNEVYQEAAERIRQK